MTTTYEYKVRDPRGNLHEGVIDAATPEDAGQQLRREGFQLLELTEGAPPTGGSLFPRRVSRSEIVYVTNQLAVMVETGISLSEALDGMASQEQNPTLKRVLGEIRAGVEQRD